MIEMAFRSEDGPILVQIGAPVATPEAEWPWNVEVRLDGRPSNVVGWDLLGTLSGALHLLSGYLCGREGLDPPVVPLPLPQPLESTTAQMRDLSERMTEGGNNMIELIFRTADGPMKIQLSTPVATPEAVRPWTLEVYTNGRPQKIYGEDPLEALELSARFTASYLSGREGLDPPVNNLPLQQAPDILAQGFREGLLAVLDVRGIACSDAVRERIAACSDPAVLQGFMARAKTAASAEEVFAAKLDAELEPTASAPG